MPGNKVAEILRFWFGDMQPDGTVTSEVFQQWWKKDTEFDLKLRRYFGETLTAAAQGKYDNWQENPDACLALIILLDQFSRNIYRGKPQGYAHDQKALAIAQKAIETGLPEQLPLIQRSFFYLPLEHAEDLALQQNCVELFDLLAKQAPTAQQALFTGFLNYAKQHRDVIAKFGRFPHRNTTLNRQSTTEEITYLKQPGSGF